LTPGARRGIIICGRQKSCYNLLQFSAKIVPQFWQPGQEKECNNL
jgi:hypothetical protein